MLELGAGTGFIGILAAKLGAQKVVATDGDWRVCEALRSNVELNGAGQTVKVGRLLWGTGEYSRIEGEEEEGSQWSSDVSQSSSEELVLKPDIVLAADVVWTSPPK